MSDINRSKESESSDHRPVDLSNLITSANHKQYLQLVPTTSLSDEDEQPSEEHLYDNASSPSSPSYQDKAAAGDSAERELQIREWQDELEKVEGEINMLRQVLGSKVRRATELKRNLGITPFKEFKQDLQSGIQQIKDSSTYQKTNETLHEWNEKLTHTSAFQKTSAVVKTASEKTSSALSTVGAVVSKKIGDIKNSQTFKSMEERVETAYASVKTSRSIESLKDRLSKVTGSKSIDDIDAAFEDAAESPSSEAGTPDDKADPSSIPPKDNVPL
ncbi:tumor protein D54-like isoform X2 [Pomacea canaliculata]|uniref:tumor protein D54-like isoform X2 n=1 Tax=Pomacea canaliculata TaxID=400727 RepID=UPI000D72CE51|nr:tumor protein D54-like isoform X2 [Pomacea canaliculata]